MAGCCPIQVACKSLLFKASEWPPRPLFRGRCSPIVLSTDLSDATRILFGATFVQSYN